MTGMELILIAGLFGVIGLGVLFLRRVKLPENGQDFAELRGQLAQMASQSNELQRLIAEQMAQSEGRLGNRLEQSLRDQNDRTNAWQWSARRLFASPAQSTRTNRH